MVKLIIVTLAIALSSASALAQSATASPNCVAKIDLGGHGIILKFAEDGTETVIETATNGEEDRLEKIKAFIAAGVCNAESIQNGKYFYL